MIFPTFSRPSLRKMSEISINTVENFGQVKQISLLTTCTTKLHRYHGVKQHIFAYSNLNFREFHPTLLLPWESTLNVKDRGGHRKGGKKFQIR